MPQNPAPSVLFVSQIIAGSGLTVTPDGGTGVVTISIEAGEVYNPASVAITGGTVNGVTIGGVTPEAGTFTALNATSLGATTPGEVVTNALHVDTGTKTVAATGGAATLNKMAGVITSEALPTAAGANYVLTLTDSDIAVGDQVMASVQDGTNSTGIPVLSTVKPGAGQVVFTVENNHLTAAFNGTIEIAFVVFKN